MNPDELKDILTAHGEWVREYYYEGNGSYSDSRRADLSRADLSGADLSDADLRGAVLRDAVGLPYAPAIPDLDAQIAAIIKAQPERLNMETWHTCETTHCRAGWAIHLAGEAGKVLESFVGPAVAGTLIYLASRPGVPVPDFYASNEAAMASILADAGVA